MVPPPFLRDLGRRIGRWPVALATCVVLAAAILLPCLGSSGLWEPSERQLSDRVAPPQDAPELTKPTPKGIKSNEDCLKIPPKDATARSLTPRAIELGRDVDDSDTGRRLPLALLGLVTAIAAAGIAMRAGGGRAGVLTAGVLLSMPLMVLQSRMLTSDIGTACGSTLILFGLHGLTRPSERHRGIDMLCSTKALVVGAVIAFYGGGALLGLLVPLGAFAAAGSFGIPMAIDVFKSRSSTGHVPAVLATLAAITIAILLAYEMYYWVEPYPGLTPPPARQMLGKAIVPEGCWSSALGAIWRSEDDIRFIFDSSFEQIAFGTFPWGVVAPIAMFGLLRSGDPDRRLIGAITLGWAAASWVATEAFHRKVGHAMWAGFPALAIAVGVWLDDVLSRRPRVPKGEGAMPAGAFLIALFVALAVLDLGKDLQSFTEKLTSLLSGPENILYPKDAKALLPLRIWVFALGSLVGLGFAVSFAAWRDEDTPLAQTARKVANIGTATMLAATLILAAFWSFGWQPALSLHLSSKKLLETYDELARPGEPLVIMGDLGYAPTFYTEGKPEKVNTRDQIVRALKRPSRVFAIAPQTELCSLHREMTDQPYFVLEDRNLRNLLLSNRVDGTEDKNPLNDMVVHKEPSPKKKPKARIVFENRVELIGWDLPDRIDRGDNFEIVTYWKVLTNVGGAWTMLMHFDGPLRLRDGDHKPIKDRCPTSAWQVGDFIIDRHSMKTSGGGFPAGKYDLWIGFFSGTAPNFKNMPISAAPGDIRDTNDRVKITSILLD